MSDSHLKDILFSKKTSEHKTSFQNELPNNSLDDNVANVKNKKNWICDFCDFTMTMRSEYSDHLVIHALDYKSPQKTSKQTILQYEEQTEPTELQKGPSTSRKPILHKKKTMTKKRKANVNFDNPAQSTSQSFEIPAAKRQSKYPVRKTCSSPKNFLSFGFMDDCDSN